MSKISVGNVFWNLRADGSELPKDVKRAITASKRQMEKTGSQFKSVGRNLTAGITAPLTGLGLASAKFAKDFKEVMLDVNKNVKGLNPTNLRDYETQLLKIGSNSFLGATGIARLASEGGKLGKSKDEALEFARAAEEIAVAFDFGRTVEGAEEAGRAVGKLESGFKITTAQVRDLADAINYFGDNTASNAKNVTDILVRQGSVVANASGLARNEIAALAATIDAAAPSPEIAATGMKNFVLALTSGAAATKAQSAAFAALGFDSVELANRMQTDAKGAILDVVKALQGMDDAKRASTMMKLFGKESIGAIAPLIKNVAALEKNLNLAGDASNFTDQVKNEFDRLNDSDVGKLDRSISSLKAAAISIGAVILPPLAAVATKVSELAIGFGDFAAANPELAQLAVVAGGVAAALGPVLIGVGMLVSSMGSLIPIVTGLTGGAGGLMGVLGAIGGVLTGPVAIGIAAIVGGAALIVANWEKVKSFLSSAAESISAAFSSWKDRNAGTIAAIQEAWVSIRESAVTIFEAIKQRVGEAIVAVDNFLGPIGGLQGAWEVASTVIKAGIDQITTTLGAAFTFISGTFQNIAAVLTGQKSLWEAFKSQVGLAIDGIITIAKGFATQIVNVFKSIDLVQIGKDIMAGLAQGIKEAAMVPVNAAKDTAKGIVDGVKGWLEIKSPSRVFKGIGGFIMQGLGLGISEDNSAVQAGIGAAQKLKGAMKGALMGGIAAGTIGVSAAAPQDGIGALAGQDSFSQEGFGGIAAQYIPEEDKVRQKFEIERAAILAETSITEQQRAELLRKSTIAREQTLAQIEANSSRNRLSMTQSFFGTLAGLANSGNKKLAAVGKAAAIVQATIDTYVGANRALAAFPPPFNFIAAGAVVATGIANVAQIKSQGAFAEGGDFVGHRAMLVGEEGPEMLVPRGAGRVLTAQETAGVSGGGTTVIVNNTFNDANPERLAEVAAELEERTKAGVFQAMSNQGPEREVVRRI